MQRIRRAFILAVWLLLLCPLAGRAQIISLDIRQELTPYNFRGFRGVPISSVTNTLAGSDGRMPTSYPDGVTLCIPTTNQYRGLMAFGGTTGLTTNQWRQLAGKPGLVAGNTPFTGTVGEQMGLPVIKTNNVVAMVQRTAIVGAPILCRPISFLFGSVVEVPGNDENNHLLTNVVKESYWQPEPFTTNNHQNAGYYWSPNARQVFAIQPGPIYITWRKAAPYTSASLPTNYTNAYGSVNFQTNGNNIYLLYTTRYIVSGSSIKPARRMYWTQGAFATLGKPIVVPTARVQGINVVYHRDFPKTVDAEYQGAGYTSPTDGSTNQTLKELRTLWFDPQQANIYAYNAEGRVFMELLGNYRDDGSQDFLGFEIVDVFKQPAMVDTVAELGELLTPPGFEDSSGLTPDPITSITADTCYFQHQKAGSDQSEYFANKRNKNPNDCLVNWMEEGVAALKWPSILARYQIVWPDDVARYSHYVRPLVDTEEEAKATAIPFSLSVVASIDYQDELDRRRAHLTDDFKFYTFLDTNYTAHRTLLRYVSGENVSFERVFSWLDTALKSRSLSNSPVATELSAYSGKTGSFNWPDVLQAPRVVNQAANVGERINPPGGEVGSMGDYMAGHINPDAGTWYDVHAYTDPLTAGFDVASRGAIIPINAPSNATLEVWWFRPTSDRVGANSANLQLNSPIAYWPSALGHYALQWPANAQEIVLASKNGAPLDALSRLGSIYYQNDSSLPGYNPNEEHAMISGDSVYATRDDLNWTNVGKYSSHPFVLVEYQAADSRPAMSVFKVLREKPSAGLVFDYLIPAGQKIQPPAPLMFLQAPLVGSGDSLASCNYEVPQTNGDFPGNWAGTNGPFGYYGQFTYMDRKGDSWVYRGPHSGLPRLETGTYNPATGTFSNPGVIKGEVGKPFTFTIHASRQNEYLALAFIDKDPRLSWLDVSTNLMLVGTPTDPSLSNALFTTVVEDSSDHSRSTNTFSFSCVASGSGLATVQGPIQITATNANTGTIYTFTDRAPFLAKSPSPTNSFTMRYYYKTEPSFAWPFVDGAPEPGSIVPYLRPVASGGSGYVGEPGSTNTAALDIVYRPYWPERDPSDSTKMVPILPFGATVTKPQLGVPGVRDMKTAFVLYQQSIAADLSTATPSVILYDPTRQKSSSLTNAGLTRIPDGVKTDEYQGRLYFPNLPPHLAERLYYDPNACDGGSLIFGGAFVEIDSDHHYLMLNKLTGSDLAAVNALCPASDPNLSLWKNLVAGLTTTTEVFVETLPGSSVYAPDSDQSVQVGVDDLAVVTSDNMAVDSYALSAAGPGSGYVTLIENEGSAWTDPGDPVALHVFRVGGSLDKGELVNIPAPNPLSEQVSFIHTADMAGHTGEYLYEWKIGAPSDGMEPAFSSYLSLVYPPVAGKSMYTLGGSGIQALGDNYVIMRYTPASTNHPMYGQWSDWTTPKLAQGWIKRVLAGINPFNQRTTDLLRDGANTDVSILTQAGRRWEGDVALNANTLNNYGLIEIYETVLRRGRLLSIESGYNYGPANDALLLAAGYLNDLYMLEGNEAWADAANPTIGIGSKDSTYGNIATALFAFKGQVPSLLEEELALVRGRDDFMQPGVTVGPFYNRLVWNYTRGIDSGEVIYALNYNIQEDPNRNPNGVIDASDAARMFPQGHGDAYGHYLTALKGYYSLLLNSCFDWVPRSEAVTILNQPVQVDYQDERKFATAAAAVARAGRQAFDLTWRRDYKSVQNSGWKHFEATKVNSQRTYQETGVTTNSVRYWGMDHWACRTGEGTYLNWVVGNAILPDVDPNPSHEGITKIDRTTVPELPELTTLESSLQTAMDNAEGGLSPLGIPEGSLAFDINPSAVVGTDNGTHFEQVYNRAVTALNNAVVSFDDAKDVTRLMRSEQDSVTDFQAGVAKQMTAYTNSLVEIYGSPYPDDMGPGKSYSQDYAGWDAFHFAYVDNVEISFPGLLETNKPANFMIDIQNYPTTYNEEKKKTGFDFIQLALDTFAYDSSNYISFTVDSHGFFKKPSNWSSKRRSPGKVQDAISKVILAHNALQKALQDNEDLKYKLDRNIELFNARVYRDDTLHGYARDDAKTQTALESTVFAIKMALLTYQTTDKAITRFANNACEALPKMTIGGVACGGDLTSPARAAILAAAGVKSATLDWVNWVKEFAMGTMQVTSDAKSRDRQLYDIYPVNEDYDLKQDVLNLDLSLKELQSSLYAINERLQELDDAQRKYQAVLAEGIRVQNEMATYNKRTAAVVQGYRTRDAAFRLFRNEKLERYKTLFDLAAEYALLAANAYDYETGLLNSQAGRDFIVKIINSRAVGVMRSGQPQYAGSDSGDPGLSSALATMKADWDVLRGRLGFNNPDAYGTTVSLRTECLRIVPGTNGDVGWRDTLQLARKANLLDDADVSRYCMQIGSGDGLPVPGLVFEFSTIVADGQNLFGRDLAAGDHAFSGSSFATKIFGVGVALEGYQGMDDPPANAGAVGATGSASPSDPGSWYGSSTAMSATPYVYLIPVGVDCMRSPPLGDASSIRNWTVEDIAIPMPFNIGASDLNSKALWQSSDSLTEPLYAIRKHQAFRPVSSAAYFSRDLYGSTGTLQRSQYTNNRLVGRSVWNTHWKLVIPGKTLLNDPNEGLDRFTQTVNDIKLHLVTYSYSGN